MKRMQPLTIGFVVEDKSIKIPWLVCTYRWWKVTKRRFPYTMSIITETMIILR